MRQVKAAIGELSDFVVTKGFKREDLRKAGRGVSAGRGRKGGAVDIHKAIGKLPKPKGGWTLPGHCSSFVTEENTQYSRTQRFY